MADLDSLQVVKDRLGAALRERTHWVFMSDGPRGHRLMGLLSLGLLGRGSSPDDFDYGIVEFCNACRGLQGIIALLSVPKDLLSRDDLNEFLGWASDVQAGPEGDLICLHTSDRGRDLMVHFWAAVVDGNMREGKPGQN
jgi:hypothetical protein